MVSRLTLAVVSAFAISLLMVGTGGAARCTPHCAPDNSNRDGEFSPEKSNKGGELRGQDRANWVHDYKNGGGSGAATATHGAATATWSLQWLLSASL
jgi:hypothetical protein